MVYPANLEKSPHLKILILFTCVKSLLLDKLFTDSWDWGKNKGCGLGEEAVIAPNKNEESVSQKC